MRKRCSEKSSSSSFDKTYEKYLKDFCYFQGRSLRLSWNWILIFFNGFAKKGMNWLFLVQIWITPIVIAYLVVIYAATWATFKPKLKKIKKKSAPKKILIFQEMELSCPKKLNTTFSNFLTSKNCFILLIKLHAASEVTTVIPFFVTYRTSCDTKGHCSHLLQPLWFVGHHVTPKVIPLNPYLREQRISLGLASILRMCLCPHS